MGHMIIDNTIVLFDDDDLEKISAYTWVIRERFGRRIVVAKIAKGGHSISMHRLIMGCSKGDSFAVTHINSCTMDNRKVNLAGHAKGPLPRRERFPV